MSMHLYGRFLPFGSNSFLVPQPDSFNHCNRNIFRSSWMNVGADFFLLFMIGVYISLYFLLSGSDQPQRPPLSWAPLFLEKVQEEAGKICNNAGFSSFISVLPHQFYWQGTLTGRFLLSSSIHWSFFCLIDNKIISHWLLNKQAVKKIISYHFLSLYHFSKPPFPTVDQASSVMDKIFLLHSCISVVVQWVSMLTII